MKRQDIVKYQQMNSTELKAEVKKLEQQLIEFTMKKNMAQVKNVREGKTIRHSIATLKSIIRNQELQAVTAGSKE